MTLYSSGLMLQLLDADIVYCDCYLHPESIFWSYYSATVGTRVGDRVPRLKTTAVIEELFCSY